MMKASGFDERGSGANWPDRLLWLRHARLSNQRRGPVIAAVAGGQEQWLFPHFFRDGSSPATLFCFAALAFLLPPSFNAELCQAPLDKLADALIPDAIHFGKRKCFQRLSADKYAFYFNPVLCPRPLVFRRRCARLGRRAVDRLLMQGAPYFAQDAV